MCIDVVHQRIWKFSISELYILFRLPLFLPHLQICLFRFQYFPYFLLPLSRHSLHSLHWHFDVLFKVANTVFGIGVLCSPRKALCSDGYLYDPFFFQHAFRKSKGSLPPVGWLSNFSSSLGQVLLSIDVELNPCALIQHIDKGRVGV